MVGFALAGGDTNVIEDCQVDTYIYAWENAGGIVGHAKESTLRISRCIYTGTIRANYVGGLVSWCDGGNITLEDCLFTGQFMTGSRGHSIILKGKNAKPAVSAYRCYYTNKSSLAIKENNYLVGDYIGTDVSVSPPSNGFYRVVTAFNGNTYYEDCTLADLKSAYDYTGQAVDLGFVVRNKSGEVVPASDYSVTILSANGIMVDSAIQYGQYTLVIESNGTEYAPGTLKGNFTVGNYVMVDYVNRFPWYELNDAINGASEYTYMLLCTDIACEGSCYTLNVSAGKDIVLDLNRHTIRSSGKQWTYYENLFRVHKGAKITIKNGTICDMSFYDGGAAIWNEGTVTLENVTIRNVYANSDGPGVHNEGTMEIFLPASPYYTQFGQLVLACRITTPAQRRLHCNCLSSILPQNRLYRNPPCGSSVSLLLCNDKEYHTCERYCKTSGFNMLF